MNKNPGTDPAKEQRAARLAAELRANLQRRKAQARARAHEGEAQAPDPETGRDEA